MAFKTKSVGFCDLINFSDSQFNPEEAQVNRKKR